jgi:hypothetical protein
MSHSSRALSRGLSAMGGAEGDTQKSLGEEEEEEEPEVELGNIYKDKGKRDSQLAHRNTQL